MRKSRVTVYLCCLFSMLFVISSDLFSVKASAAVSPDASNEWFLLPFDEFKNKKGTFSESSGTYNLTGLTGSVDGWSNSFTCSDIGGVFPALEAGHKYLIYATVSASISNSDFSITSWGIRVSGAGDVVLYPGSVSREMSIYDSTFTLVQFAEYTPSVDRVLSTNSVLSFQFTSTASYTNRASWAFYTLDITDNTDSEVNQIVAAINNQTSSLKSSISSAANQITDKIDEVLTPEGDHNFDTAIGNVNDKINENMGALGFAHSTVTQFADLFTETPGDPVITVPPLKMKIKGEEYEFFHGYQYDFRSMETGGLAVLVNAVRTTGTIAIWMAFLYYCNKEFNNFFRR